jgi:hypothetical protein
MTVAMLFGIIHKIQIGKRLHKNPTQLPRHNSSEKYERK